MGDMFNGLFRSKVTTVTSGGRGKTVVNVNGTRVEVDGDANVEVRNGKVFVNGKAWEGKSSDGVAEVRVLEGKINVLSIDSGNVTCGDVSGDVRVGNGNVKAGDVKGNVRVDSGIVNCDDVGGNVNGTMVNRS